MAFAVTERARVSYAGDAAEPMDVENARAATSSYDPTATVEDDPTREIVLAAYRGDVARVSRVLRRCGADAPLAEMSLTRADALTLLGENVYLGSHSWSTQEGFPVMYFAAKWGGWEVTKVLLEAGAMVAQSTTLGVQPLHMAAQEGQIEVAKLLIEHGAPCGCTDRAGWSSFHYAANHRWATWVGPIDGQLAVLELLATHGADINAGDGEGYTCVHSAAQSGKVAIVKLLRRLGARPDATTVRGVMPIHVAAEGGRAEVVDELLRWCPDVLEAEDCRGHRPIHHAAYHGHANVVEVLLRHGAKVCPGPSASSWERGQGTGQGTGQGGQGSQGRQQQGTTPLHLAVRSSKGTGALEVVMVLLAGGADPTLLDSHGWTPRALAAECARRRPGDVAVFLALDHVLKQAEVGVPLIWSRAGHHKYTPHFKSHAKDLLRAMSAPMHLHNVQGLVAEKIVDEVLRAAAKSAWPEVSVETWGSIERTRRAAEARWEAVSVCTHDGCGRLKLELGWYGAAGYQCVVAPAPAMGAGGVRGHSGSVHGRSGRVERERSVRARTAEKATNSNSDEGEEEVQSAPLSDHVHHAHFHQQLQHQQQFQHQQQLQYQQQQQLTMNFIMYQQQQQHIVNSAA